MASAILTEARARVCDSTLKARELVEAYKTLVEAFDKRVVTELMELKNNK